MFDYKHDWPGLVLERLGLGGALIDDTLANIIVTSSVVIEKNMRLPCDWQYEGIKETVDQVSITETSI